MNSNKQNLISIETLNHLTEVLKQSNRSDYNEIMNNLDLPKYLFDCYCSWSNECYTRNCIVDNESFELILLCWEAGQATPIHDHGGEECWVKVIQGEFKETIYRFDSPGKIQTLRSTVSKKGDLSYMIDFMGFHRLENISETRSMSLHLYAKPIRNCNLFDEDSGKLVYKELVYNTCHEVEVEVKSKKQKLNV